MKLPHTGTLAAILVYLNGAVCVLGFIVLPALVIRDMLVYSWCAKSYFLYKLPVFSVSLSGATLTEGGVCTLESTYVMISIFRISYLILARNSIINVYVIRMKRTNIDPTRWFVKGIFVASIITVFAIVFLLSPSAEVINYGIRRSLGLSMSALFLIAYVVPEVVLWIWYVIFGQEDV
jgi:hypothetical protein